MSLDTAIGLANVSRSSRAAGKKVFLIAQNSDRSGSADSGTLPSVKHGLGVLSDQSKFLEMEQGNLDRRNGDDGVEADGETRPVEPQSSRSSQEAQPPQAQPQRQQEQNLNFPVGAEEPSPWQNADVKPGTGLTENDDIVIKSKSKKDAKKAKADKKKSKSKKSKTKPIETASEDKKENVRNDRPPANGQHSSNEEAILNQLVRELEFGTLLNSISILNQLVSKYPEDPDYRSLLAMAIRLRHGDVWYQYQRKVDVKEEPEPKVPATNIIKPTANESVNELKKSSWFLMRSAKP